MKRAYAVSQYGKCYEQYCKEYLPQQAKEIFDKAEQYYKEFVKNDMPDLGENLMAKNMLTISWTEKCFSISSGKLRIKCVFWGNL